MKATEIIELVYSAMPYPSQIKNLQIRNESVCFTWRGDKFEVTSNLTTMMSEDGILTGDNQAILIERLLKNENNARL